MSESTIQRRLYFDYQSSSECMCPNYTPRGWWECDLWRITKAGYVYEYEIKLSASDFRADFKKARRRYDRALRVWREEYKHKMLAERSVTAPNYFTFVMPQGLVDESEIPEYAGVIFLNEHGFFASRKKSPKLHKCKTERTVIDHARHCMSHRYWNLRNKIALQRDK